MQLHSRDFHSLSDSQTPTQLHSHPFTLMPTPIDAHGPEILCHIYTLSQTYTRIRSRSAAGPQAHPGTLAPMHGCTRAHAPSHTHIPYRCTCRRDTEVGVSSFSMRLQTYSTHGFTFECICPSFTLAYAHTGTRMASTIDTHSNRVGSVLFLHRTNPESCLAPSFFS